MKNKKLVIWILVIAVILIIIYFANQNKPVKDVLNTGGSIPRPNGSNLPAGGKRTKSGTFIFPRG